MSWLPILLLGLAAFALAAGALKLPRATWSLFGAALLFGLAGYALQGSPGYSSAPAAPPAADVANGAAMVEARRQFYDDGLAPGRTVTLADAFARRGQYQEAVGFYRNGLTDAPDDPELWVALGNALVEHTGGAMTPAALEAFERGAGAARDDPAPPYFQGIAALRTGDFIRAREFWAAARDKAPAGSGVRSDIEARLARLDALLAQLAGQGAQDGDIAGAQ